MSDLRSNYFLGVRVDELDRQQAMAHIRTLVENRSGEMDPVFFVNVHSIFLSMQDHGMMEQLNHASLTLADGSGLDWAGRILGQPIKENLNGTDLTPHVLKAAEENGWSVYFLGAKEKVMNRVVEVVNNDYPSLKLAGYHHGYFDEVKEQKIIDEINELKPDILLVGLGSPRQESWIWDHRNKLNVSAGFAIGGFFDFMSGEFNRAPLWMRKAGIEWIYRFFNDPSTKWKRIFIEIPIFIPLIILAQLIPKKSKVLG